MRKLITILIIGAVSVGAWGQATNKIESTGDVGIGTTSPSNTLTVNGNFKVYNGENYFSYNGAADLHLKYAKRGSGGRAIVHYEGNRLWLNFAGDFSGGTNIGTKTFFSNSGSSYINTGKVGINTSAPTFELEVKKKSDMSTAWMPNLLLNNGWGGIGSEGLRIRSAKEGFNFDIFSYDHEIENDAFLGFKVWKGNISDQFSANSAQMVLTDDGKVGIGTTNPSEKLDIAGNLKTKRVALFDWDNTSVGYTNSTIALNGIRQNGEWKLYSDGARSSIGLINMDIFSNIRFVSHHDDTYKSGKTMTDEELIKNNTKLIIKSNGSVGIGTTTPSAKLDVAGNIKAQEIEVTLASMEDLNLNGTLAANNITVKANGNTADFVFSDTYKLKDLTEVETFIKTNKHLENIPSATEMEEQGVNLAEMNKLLLQKVEELTLYAIEKDKEVESLEERLAKIEALIVGSAQ